VDARQPCSTMIFTSFEYVLFFVIVLVGRSLIRNYFWEKLFLLVASFAFYMSWSIPCGFLILATSLIDYFVGVGLGRIEDPRGRRMLLIASIVANLGVLAFFKYTNFILANVSSGLALFGFHTPPWQYDIILPAGISFFTFQSMTYTIETYRRNIKPCHTPSDFLLFVSFFPQLLAGPINRAKDLLPQFSHRVRATAAEFESGLLQFGIGALKKLAISDQIAGQVDLIFATPGKFDGFTLLQGALGYGIQIYCDFSGYSDMAIGSARMMGFKFMENFQMPYSSVTITEFWRRWHISLSSWFRDYLYIPLGGNRKGETRTYVNLLTTMLLCGLWHGASWNFVVWGGLNGVALSVHRIWTRINPLPILEHNLALSRIWNLFSRFLTLFVVLIGWVFFRAQSLSVAWEYLTSMLSRTHSGQRFVSPYIWPAFFALLVTHLLVQKDRNLALELPEKGMFIRVVGYTAILLMIVCLGATDSAPFIYFQF
jgi:alginate O-acetyltransferase complex protein AlgI